MLEIVEERSSKLNSDQRKLSDLKRRDFLKKASFSCPPIAQKTPIPYLVNLMKIKSWYSRFFAINPQTTFQPNLPISFMGTHIPTTATNTLLQHLPPFHARCPHLTFSSLSQVLKTISHITSTMKFSSVCPASNVMFLFGSLLPSIPHRKEKEEKSNNHTHKKKPTMLVLPYGNILGPTFKVISPLYNPSCQIVRASGASLRLTHLCILFDTQQPWEDNDIGWVNWDITMI